MPSYCTTAPGVARIRTVALESKTEPVETGLAAGGRPLHAELWQAANASELHLLVRPKCQIRDATGCCVSLQRRRG